MVVSEHRMLANSKVHGITTHYHEFDLLDLLSVKFYVILFQYLTKYFKFRSEMPKIKNKKIKPYFSIIKKVYHNEDAPMIDTEVIIKRTKQIKRKNIKQNG
jgi:hypothetical protein